MGGLTTLESMGCQDGRLTDMLCRLVSNRGRHQKKRRRQGIEARRSKRDWPRGREEGADVRVGVSSGE
jgi:hypothetical protein